MKGTRLKLLRELNFVLFFKEILFQTFATVSRSNDIGISAKSLYLVTFCAVSEKKQLIA